MHTGRDSTKIIEQHALAAALRVRAARVKCHVDTITQWQWASRPRYDADGDRITRVSNQYDMNDHDWGAWSDELNECLQANGVQTDPIHMPGYAVVKTYLNYRQAEYAARAYVLLERGGATGIKADVLRRIIKSPCVTGFFGDRTIIEHLGIDWMFASIGAETPGKISKCDALNAIERRLDEEVTHA